MSPYRSKPKHQGTVQTAPRQLLAEVSGDELQFDSVQLWVFKGTELVARYGQFADPERARAAKTCCESGPSQAALRALRGDAPIFWSALPDGSLSPARGGNTVETKAGAVREHVVIPVRLAHQICHIWEISRLYSRGSAFESEALERLCGKLYLMSCKLQAENFFKITEVELRISITPREIEILRWFKQGKTYSEIAAILGISSKTVDYHFSQLMRKLNVNDKLSAVLKSARLGLIDIDWD